MLNALNFFSRSHQAHKSAAPAPPAAEENGDRVTLSGTGYATPVVTGLAALLAQEHPNLSGKQLKDLLIATCQSHEPDRSNPRAYYNAFYDSKGEVHEFMEN